MGWPCTTAGAGWPHRLQGAEPQLHGEVRAAGQGVATPRQPPPRDRFPAGPAAAAGVRLVVGEYRAQRVDEQRDLFAGQLRGALVRQRRGARQVVESLVYRGLERSR